MTGSLTSTYENESMFRTLGASGISINKELVKKVRRLLASRFEGTSIADSFTVRSSSSLFIWSEKNYIWSKHLEACHLSIKKCCTENSTHIHDIANFNYCLTTFSSQASVSVTFRGNLIAPEGWNNWYSWSHVVVSSFLRYEPPWFDSTILSCCKENDYQQKVRQNPTLTYVGHKNFVAAAVVEIQCWRPRDRTSGFWFSFFLKKKDFDFHIYCLHICSCIWTLEESWYAWTRYS